MHKLSILALTSLLVILLPAAILPSYSVVGPPPDGPGNTWAPYGPGSSRLELRYFADEGGEFASFELGELDLTDWQVPVSKFAQYENNPDFVLAPTQGQFGIRNVDYNHRGAGWIGWGCDFNHGNSACGAEIRKGLNHLVDMAEFSADVLLGEGQSIAANSPPAKDPAGPSLATQQSWDTLHPNTISAFNIAPDDGGFAQAGSLDFCAARDHLLAANVGFVDANSDCVIDNPPSTQLQYVIRADDPQRRPLGQGMAAAIERLFGGANVVNEINVQGTAGARPIVFVVGTTGNDQSRDYDMYTGGWGLGGVFPDHYRQLYGGVSASDFCGGTPSLQPLNYGIICIPDADNAIDAAALTDSIPEFRALTLQVFDELGQRAAHGPSFALASRFVASRDVAGAVNERGEGYGTFWSLLNGRDSSYTPVDSRFTFGGGDPSTLRWGQRVSPTRFNMFHATTFWDFNFLAEIYDGLIATSPVEPGKVFGWMANKFETSFADFEGDGDEDTFITFTLRDGLRWHDGQRVTPEDVKFSILNYRDIPADNLSGAVEFVLDVVILNERQVTVVWEQRSISHLLNSGVPLIPSHVWECPANGIGRFAPNTPCDPTLYGDAAQADLTMSSDAFDPLLNNALVGSGPFMCRDIFGSGVVGGRCARTAAGDPSPQGVPVGGTALLERFDRTGEFADKFVQYFHTYNEAWPAGGSRSGQFQEWNWADAGNLPNEVDIDDLRAVAQCFGSAAAACDYWERLETTVGTATYATVRAHLDDTWVWPFAWSSVDLDEIVPPS